VALSANLIAAIADKQHRPIIKLEIDWDGDGVFDDETGYVLEAAGVESFDPDTGALQPGECNLTLDNLNQRFSAENENSPIYPYLTGAFLSTKARISLGYFYNGSPQLREIGIYIVRSIAPREQARVAQMRLLDISARFSTVPTYYGPRANVALSTVFSAFAEKAGLGTASYAAVGTAFGTAQFAAATGEPLGAELGLLAIAEGGRVFVDEDGVLTFNDRTTHQAALRAPLITLDKESYPFEISILRNTETAINRALLEYEDRASAVSDETVFQITTPIAVPGAQEVTGSSVGTYYEPGQITISIDAQDKTRWIDYTPVTWASVGTAGGNNPSAATAASAPTGGTAIPMAQGSPASRLSLDGNLYYELTVGGTATGDGNRANVTFRNLAGTATAYVTTFTLIGKPARLSSLYATQADDADGQEVLGGQILPLSLRNPYLPSTDAAYQRVVDLLYFRSVRRIRISLDSAPGVPLKAGEVFGVIDSVKNKTYLQQVATINWRFNAQSGYECSIEGLPSLPGPLQLEFGDVIAAPTDVITTALNEGPWYWAPVDDPEDSALTWDNSLWGPLSSPTPVGDSVGAISDIITTSVVQVLTWDAGYWDVNPWG
jgi:hypothetical protein